MILLFCLSYISLRYLIRNLSFLFHKRSRIRWVEKQDDESSLSKNKLLNHIRALMEVTGYGRDIQFFVWTSIVLALIGMWLGLFFFLSLKGVIIMVAVLAGIPYLWLRMRLLTLQSKTRLEFLPAVEVFYQQYLLLEGRNVRNILHQLLLEQRMRYPMRTIFEQLDRNLSAHRSVEESLQIFALSLGHRWGQYFVNILRASIQEGAKIDENLRELITDMRKAQISEKQERNRLLEIRIANFSPILFLIVFMGVNFKLDAQMAYTYYVLDPEGRDLLLDALLLIFLSFVMGVYLSFGRKI